MLTSVSVAVHAKKINTSNTFGFVRSASTSYNRTKRRDSPHRTTASHSSAVQLPYSARSRPDRTFPPSHSARSCAEAPRPPLAAPFLIFFYSRRGTAGLNHSVRSVLLMYVYVFESKKLKCCKVNIYHAQTSLEKRRLAVDISPTSSVSTCTSTDGVIDFLLVCRLFEIAVFVFPIYLLSLTSSPRFDTHF